MGEESDGDAGADLLAEDEADEEEPAAEPSADSDADADGSRPEGADEPEDRGEPSVSPADSPPTDEPSPQAAEDGGNLSRVEPDEEDAPDSDEGDGDESEGTDREGDETDGDGEEADGTENETNGDGNLSRVEPDEERDRSPHERPDVSLNPDDLTSGERQGPGNAPRVTPEEATEPAPPDVEDVDGIEDEGDEEDEEDGSGSAPLAEDVAKSKLEEAASRSEPLEDEEMPLADHIEEMLRRLAIVIVVAGVVSLAVFPFSETVINFLWNSILPAGESTRPRIYSPLALLLTKLKVASLAGLIIALPVLVYETYLFMRPGLYPHERRYYLAAVPTSLVLAFVGISFAYFLVLPVIFTYFLYYSEDVTTIAFALTKTFNLILLLMGYLAIVFQIPLFIMLAIMMGLTTRRWLVARRLYFWGAFLGISFLFSPDPTGMAPIMVATTMVVLFEGTLFLLKWTGR